MRRPLVVLVALLVWSGGGLAPAAADTGPWVWPVEGPRQVSRAFDPPASTYSSGHRGADLPSSPGAAVRAAGAGRVSYAGLLAGRGVVVVVHGTLRTTYEPVSALVAVDDEVAEGEVVGTLEAGHQGCPVAACLHWGLRRGETYLDPVRLVVSGPVRLLPVRLLPVRLLPVQGGGSGAGLVGAAPAPGGPRRGDLAGGPPVEPRPADGGSPAAGDPRSAVPPNSAAPPAVAGPPRSALGDTAPVELRPDLEPVSSTRATGLGLLAVALLVAGVGLLARPRPTPPPPAGSPARAVTPEPDPWPGPAQDTRPHAGPDAGDLLDLQAERARRRGA